MQTFPARRLRLLFLGHTFPFGSFEAFAIPCTVKVSWKEKKSFCLQFPENFLSTKKGNKDLLDSENFIFVSFLLHEI